MPIDDTDSSRLNRLDQLVYQKTGHSLTNLQQLILRECWQPSKKTYEQIAESSNYSGRYIQQRVAPQLWQLMSEIVGAKVTKSNCRSVVSRYLELEYLELEQALSSSPEQGLSEEALSEEALSEEALSNSDYSRDRLPKTVFSIAQSITAQSTTAQSSHADALDTLLVEAPSESLLLEFPMESVPLGSPYYIQRDEAEADCYELIEQPGALIRIKAPRQMGKTSLMNRIIAYAQSCARSYAAVVLNFQQIDTDILFDLDRLLRWVCANIAHQLNLPSAIGEFWDDDIGSKMSCTLYMEECILGEIDTPIILAIEESHELFDSVSVSQAFFGMLRSWHECTKHTGIWQKLRIILVQSTDAYVPLNVNQSPFNIGFEMTLAPFEPVHVSILAERSGLSLADDQIEQLMTLLGGHPYLIRLALYRLAKQSITWERLLAIAPTDEGIFKHHLHRHLWILNQHTELRHAFVQVVSQTEPVKIPQELAFKLQSMGLVRLSGNQVQVSCELYRQYFRNAI